MPDTSACATCRVCGATAPLLWTTELLGRPVRYFECLECGYVQTEAPTWLNLAYSRAINDSDTGIVARNLTNRRIVLSTLLLLGRSRGKVVDCAGGVGLLVRLLRDAGVDAYWSDPYCENVLARGFEDHSGRADLVTAFEAFEHFEHPLQELERLLSIAPNVLLSTEIIPDPAPPPGTWWYYGSDHGQHLGFLRPRTLEVMARRCGKHVVSDGSSYHLIAARRIKPIVWRSFLRGARLTSAFVAKQLESRTWADYKLMTAGQGVGNDPRNDERRI